MKKDLTQGSPTKLIINFSLPLIFGFFFQQFYSFVDAAIVGKTLGLDSLAAVGSTGSLNFLILGFCMGICSGFAIPVAQAFGAKDIPMLRKYVINGVLLGIAAALVVTLTTVTFCRGMLRLTHTPNDIIDEAYRYIVVIFAFIPVTIFYNFLSGVIRALGDSRTPVIFLVIASFINILLDFVFILFFKMGVIGAALATGVSQLIAGIGCLLTMIRHIDVLTFEKSDWHFDKTCVRNLLAQGLPMGLQFSITAIGSVILSASVNTLGSVAVGAVTAGGKISMFFMSVIDALSSTIATYSGQNVGAGRVDRIRQGFRSCAVVGILYCLAATLVIYLFGRNLLSLFVSSEETEALNNAYRYLLLNSLFYIPLLYLNLIRLMIQGVGYTSLAIFSGVFEMLARTAAGLFLVPAAGFTAACFANPLAWVGANLFLFPAKYMVLKKLDQKINLQKQTQSLS